MSNAEIAQQLVGQTKTHEEWLAIVRFGLPTLLKEQEVLIQLICDEAERELVANAPDDDRPRTYEHDTAKMIASICSELGLTFTVANAEEPETISPADWRKLYMERNQHQF